MEVKSNLSVSQIFNFLKNRGYKIKSFYHRLPPSEEMLVSEPEIKVWGFTATKGDEAQSEDNLYLKVFEKEMKELLNNL